VVLTLKTQALAARRFDRILLIKLSAFGDIIHTLPVLVKLRDRYPAARIDWLITPENAELVRYHPALSNVVPFQRHDYVQFGRSLSATRGLLRLALNIRRTAYDLVVDLHGQFRSALFALASGAPVRVGFDGPQRQTARAERRRAGKQPTAHGWTGAREGSWLAYSHHIPIPRLNVHAIDRYLWLGDLLGFGGRPPDCRLYWPPAADNRVAALLCQHGLTGRPFAVLAPTTIWPTKHWRAEGFAEVGRFLTRAGLAVVLAGSSQERVRCRQVAAACPGARDLSGETTLAELAALVRQAQVVITNDSGPMHLAVALGRPVVSVFGPTDPVCIGPYGRPDAVVQADLPCVPCYFKKLSQCPHDHACMKQVTAGQVIERLERMLPQLRPAGGQRIQWASRCG
jgi:lipopolysaccharide heptosyltransferase I